MKKTKKKFEKAVLHTPLKHVKIFHRTIARCRQFMFICLRVVDSGNIMLTYESIKHFVKMIKTHWDIGDQEKVVIKMK